MRTIGIILTVISSVIIVIDIAVGILGHYQYSKQYESYWELSVKASSIEKKKEAIDKFVQALEKSNLNSKYNTLFLETPNNSFDENFAALKSLQIRLHDISKMDIKSFEYQTALQQITGQEQNEAAAMLSVFSGIWWKENHFFLWDWIAITQIIFFVILGFVGVYYWGEDSF
jgi:hypothetical protein